MLTLAASLLIALAQPAEIDWNPRPAPESPPMPAKPSAGSGILGFGPPKPQTEEERIAAANAAALARAEQAGKEAGAPPGASSDDGKMRCKTTDVGFVCGNSDRALEPDSPSRQALDQLLKPD